MSELGDRLLGAEARAAVVHDAEVLEAIGSTVAKRARRRRTIRRGATGVAAAIIVAGGVTVGWSVANDEPIAPEPSPSASSSPSPSFPVTPEPQPSVDIAYQVIDGVTVSEYLPDARPAAPEVWARVDSGWVLAAYEGGTLAPDRTTASSDGPFLREEGFGAVRGPVVLYLVSPDGEVFEAANLSEADAGDLIAWNVESGHALIADRWSQQYQSEPRYYRDLNLVTGEWGPWFTLSQDDDWRLRQALPWSEGWAITAEGYAEEGGTSTVLKSVSVVDSRGARVLDGPYLDPAADFIAMIDGTLISSYWGDRVDGVNPTSLFVGEGGAEGAAVEVPAPLGPDGEEPWMCRPYRLASPDAVALECAYGVENVDYPFASTVFVFDEASSTFERVVGPDTNNTFGLDASVVLGCVRGGTAYGLHAGEQTDYLAIGLGARRDGSDTLLDPAPGDYLALQCVGAQGENLVIKGAGSVWLLGPEDTFRASLLATPEPINTSDGTLVYVSGVTDLGVFVAP